MNLEDLNGNILVPKPWLNIVANTVSTLFGVYMNGGFPVSFQGFSQLEAVEVVNTAVEESVVADPIVPPSYGDLSFPILSSGIQIFYIIPFKLAIASSAVLTFRAKLNGTTIGGFNTGSATTIPNSTGWIQVCITYDDVNHVLNCSCIVTAGNTGANISQGTLIVNSYTAGDVNDFDFTAQFSVANIGNTFNIFSISEDVRGLFNSE